MHQITGLVVILCANQEKVYFTSLQWIRLPSYKRLDRSGYLRKIENKTQFTSIFVIIKLNKGYMNYTVIFLLSRNDFSNNYYILDIFKFV